MISRALVAAAVSAAAFGFGRIYRAGGERARWCTDDTCGEPRMWTPLIEAGEHEKLQTISALNLGNRTSYAGYVTVDNTSNANSFVWLWPALNGGWNAPLVIWLQGGPGGSSLFGMFVENGPFNVLDDGETLVPNAGSWATDFSYMAIDNPRGTGYSYTDPGTLCTNYTCYGQDLDTALRQVLTAFPQLQNVPVYITGESYAGKYVPVFGATVLANNAAGAQPHVNLAGIAIGDGFTVPHLMVNGYADLLLQVGMISPVDEYATALSYQANISAAIAAGDNSGAFRIWDAFLNGDLLPPGVAPWFINVTGSNDYYNINRDSEPASYGNYVPFVTSPAVRAAIGVGNNTYHQDTAVEFALIPDFMVDQAPRLEAVLNAGLQVLIYNGQLDIICGAPLTEAYVPTLQWNGAAGWAAAPKQLWRSPIDGTVAGYVKQYGNFSQLVLRGAGHIAPYDQPARSLDMITRFIRQMPWTN